MISKESDLTTEEKIKKAADKLFSEKGFEGTKTREIAQEAGINSALLNYYFRSKEKLFQTIMMEKIQTFFEFMFPLINNPKIELYEKIEFLTNSYISLLIENPHLSTFIINEIDNKSNLLSIFSKMIPEVEKIAIYQQIKAKNPKVNPIQIFMNLVSLVIFPFIMMRLVKTITFFSEKEMEILLEERRKMIPVWIREMIENTR